MNQLYTIFVKKKISFVGTKEELQLYQNGLGYPTDVQRNLGLVFNEDALEAFNSEEISEKICQYLKSEIEACA